MTTPETYQLVAKIVRAMVDDGCPPDRAMRAESAILQVVFQAMKPVREAREVAAILPFGVNVIQEFLGCSRATAYRLKKSLTKHSDAETVS